MIFEIRDSYENDRLLGYLFYYERSRRFFIELLSELDEWSAPFLLAPFVRKGIYSIGSEWSMKFVNQRIIPPDRQNLGAILRDNGLKSYEPIKLLQLSEGRCAQDELHLVKTSIDYMNEEILRRLKLKVKDVMTLSDYKVMVFFNDETSMVVDIEKSRRKDRLFGNILKYRSLFENVRVSPGGNGIEWGEDRFISSEELRKEGAPSEIKYDDLKGFIKNRVADTTDVSERLNCSRQNIAGLCEREVLNPIKNGSNNKLFLMGEVESSQLA